MVIVKGVGVCELWQKSIICSVFGAWFEVCRYLLQIPGPHSKALCKHLNISSTKCLFENTSMRYACIATSRDDASCHVVYKFIHFRLKSTFMSCSVRVLSFHVVFESIHFNLKRTFIRVISELHEYNSYLSFCADKSSRIRVKKWRPKLSNLISCWVRVALTGYVRNSHPNTYS